MTNEKAAEILLFMQKEFSKDEYEALNIAIRMLEQEPCKLSEIPTGSESSEKINCKSAKCENCINHNYCDYEPRKSEG